MRSLILFLLFNVWSIQAFGPALPKELRPSATRLGISEALGRYIDNEYYRQNHKEEYSAQWMHENKAAILYHDHHGGLVMGDPHIDFNTPHHVSSSGTESAQHYVSTHPGLMCNLGSKIMELRPHEFMRACHNCGNRGSCNHANDYYDEFLAAFKPKDDAIAYAYLR